MPEALATIDREVKAVDIGRRMLKLTRSCCILDEDVQNVPRETSGEGSHGQLEVIYVRRCGWDKMLIE